MPLGLTPAHLLLILVIALIVVGPGKLPDVGAALGKSIKEFRKAASDVQEATSLTGTPAPASPAQTAAPAPAAPAPAPAMAAPVPAPVVAAPVGALAAAPVEAAPAVAAVEAAPAAPESVEAGV